jgi:hypothetical protein
LLRCIDQALSDTCTTDVIQRFPTRTARGGELAGNEIRKLNAGSLGAFALRHIIECMFRWLLPLCSAPLLFAQSDAIQKINFARLLHFPLKRRNTPSPPARGLRDG